LDPGGPLLPDLPILVAAFGICFAAALVQGVVGFGFALLSVPLCALVDTSLVPVPQAILSLFLSLPMAIAGRHHLQPRRVAWVLAGWLPGVGAGLLLLRVLPPRTLTIALAIFVLVAVTLVTLGLRLRRRPPTELAVGFFAGLGSLVSSISGPPVALLYKDEHGPSLRANLALIFVAGVCLTLTGRLIAGRIGAHDLAVAACLAPALLLALLAARVVAPRVEGPRLRGAVLLLAGLAGVTLLLRAL